MIEYWRMAGQVGFEPTVHGIKTRCLTTWLLPSNGAGDQFQLIEGNHTGPIKRGDLKTGVIKLLLWLHWV